MRFLFSILLFLLAAPVYAAPLTGTVRDSASNPIAGAEIRLPDLNLFTRSGSDGAFQFADVPRGRQLLTAGFPGYATVITEVSADSLTGPLTLILHRTVLEQPELVVTGQRSTGIQARSPSPVQSISLKALQERGSTNIVDALTRLPGVSQITTGPAISKPVIRGLGYNRIVTLQNGIRQEGQQWGDEHGLEIDDYDVSRIEVLKGPASLLYGSDALGGVINILPADIPHERLAGRAAINYQTNPRLAAAHLQLGGRYQRVGWSLYGTGKRAQDYRNRYDGPVFNTRFRNADFGGQLSIQEKNGFTRFYASSFQQQLGIAEGDRDSATGRFIRVVNDGGQEAEQIAQGSDYRTYALATPYQDIRHRKAALEQGIFFGSGARLNLTAAFQQNDRQEFEDVLNPDEPALHLRLRTVNWAARFTPHLKSDAWKASLGATGMAQWNRNLGEEYLVPEYRLTEGGVYAVADGKQGRWYWTAGLRYDIRALATSALSLDSNGAPVPTGSAEGYARFRTIDRTFQAPTGALGASYELGKGFFLKANVAAGFRAPNIAELSANGVHEGTLRYEFGNAALRPEHSIQGDLGLSRSGGHALIDVALFANRISNFIYLQKLTGAGGQDSIPAQNNEEGYAAFAYNATDAWLYGGEVFADLHPHPLDWLHLEVTASVVWGQSAIANDSMRYLPGIPQPRIAPALRATRPALGRYLRNIYARAEADCNLAQRRIFSAYGTETPASAYVLLNAGIGADITNRAGKTLATLVLAGQNLTDASYQQHLSRLRYAPVNQASGRTGIWNMGRNISMTLTVPFTALQ